MEKIVFPILWQQKVILLRGEENKNNGAQRDCQKKGAKEGIWKM